MSVPVTMVPAMNAGSSHRQTTPGPRYRQCQDRRTRHPLHFTQEPNSIENIATFIIPGIQIGFSFYYDSVICPEPIQSEGNLKPKLK